MAKTKIKGLEYPRPKSSLYLCCFGISSLPDKAPTESNITGSDEHNLKQKSRSNNRWFPWQNIRLQVKSQSTRTVPLEGSECYDREKLKLKLKPKGKANTVHSSKRRSKSNLSNRTQADIPPPPSQTPPVFPVTPNQKPSQSQTPHQNSENNNVDVATCRKSSSPPTRAPTTAMSHAVSLPTSKRHVRRLLSSMQVQPQTTPKEPKQHQNAKRYNPVVGTCVVMVTVVIMILWGRLCAIVCTSVWLYFVPRFRHAHKNDVVENAINNSNDLDLDSKVSKKKVVLEGLLERNHSGML